MRFNMAVAAGLLVLFAIGAGCSGAEEGAGSASEEGRWRVASIRLGIPLITTLAGARAVVGAIQAMKSNEMTVKALQDYHLDGRRR